jgi:predicted hydrolase (HD superfamily)
MPTRDEAWEVLCRYNKDEFHLKHARTVEAVMRWYAKKDGFENEEDFWGIVGLLHDLDFEMYPDEHCTKVQEIMRGLGWDERLIHAVASHGYGITVDVKPEHQMEKVLFTIDELSGLIGAAVLVLPSKDIQDLQLKTIKKKFKDKRFAAGCSRDIISRGCEMLDESLDDVMADTLKAMQENPVE